MEKKEKKKGKGGGLAHIRYRSSGCFLDGPKGPFPGLGASWVPFYLIFSSCLSRSDRREVGGGGMSKAGTRMERAKCRTSCGSIDDTKEKDRRSGRRDGGCPQQLRAMSMSRKRVNECVSNYAKSNVDEVRVWHLQIFCLQSCHRPREGQALTTSLPCMCIEGY